MLITEEYRQLNARQHYECPEWGRQSMKWWRVVKYICDQMKLKTFLDYGCGKQMLKDAMGRFGYDVVGYDPAFPELSAKPEPHDLVICTDVLEHIEPDCIDEVLQDLKRVTRKTGFFVVATREAKSLMADGSNPHRIVQPLEWWLEKIEALFTLEKVNSIDDKVFALLVHAK